MKKTRLYLYLGIILTVTLPGCTNLYEGNKAGKAAEKINILIEKGDVDNALRTINPLIKKYHTEDLYIAKAKLLYMKSGSKKALNITEKYLKRHKIKKIGNLLFVIKLLIEENQLDKANKYNTEVLKQDPWHPIALYYEGIIAQKRGNFVLAIKDYKKCISYTNIINNAKSNYNDIMEFINEK